MMTSWRQALHPHARYVCLLLTIVIMIVIQWHTTTSLRSREQESPPCDLGPPFTPPEHIIVANSSRPSCPTTFVTQYFRIPSKHSDEEYKSWIGNLRGMCLLVFTDSPWLWHAADQVILVKTDICEEGRALNRSACFWREQWYQDPEAHIHRSYQLYLTWNLKPWFVKEAVRLNPFGSEWFFWVDAGYMRGVEKPQGIFSWMQAATPITPVHGDHDATHLVPKLVLVSATAMNLLMIQPFSPQELQEGGGFHYTTGQDRLAGNMWGGTAAAVCAWADLYYQTFNAYVVKGWFVGKDQNIMNTLCLGNPGACVILDPHVTGYENPWFTMWPCLLGQRECSAHWHI